jgi:putative ABC transport system permease protein
MIAVTVIVILLPSFNAFVGKQISSGLLMDVRVLTTLLGFAILIGFLSGSYPAFFLSRFKPAMAIKGFSAAGKKSGGLRQGLVVFNLHFPLR